MLHTCIVDIPFNVLSLTHHFDSTLLCLTLFPKMSAAALPLMNAEEGRAFSNPMNQTQSCTFCLCFLFPGFPATIVCAFHQNV